MNSWNLNMPLQLGIAVINTMLILSFLGSVGDCISLPGIHWNSSNPMFKTSNNDHIIEVNLYDEIDFICPHFPQGTDPHLYEYYIIHQVTKKEYDDCSIYSDSTAVMIVNCSDPRQRKRFTILFEPFQSIPNVPEFRAGGTYYYISTSSGSKDGIMNLQRGACHYKNMKLTIRVCCEPSTTTPTLAASNTTTLVPSVQPSSAPPRETAKLQTSSTIPTTRGTRSSSATTTSTTPSTKPTTTTTTATRSTGKHPPSPEKGSSTDPSIKYTDKSSGKPDTGGSKNSENEVLHPKQEGLVNDSSARTPHYSHTLLGCSVTFLVVYLVWR